MNTFQRNEKKQGVYMSNKFTPLSNNWTVV